MSENGLFSPPFFIGGVILQYPNGLHFAGTMFFWDFYRSFRPTPGTPLSPFRSPMISMDTNPDEGRASTTITYPANPLLLVLP
jgi:hypothetical protein